LKPAGYQVTQVRELTAAKSIMRTSPVDSIILDAGLGGQQHEFIRDLVKTFPATPLILIGSGEDEGSYVDIMRQGVFDYLTPPLKPDVVVETVKRSIEQRARLNSWAQDRYRRDTDVLRRRVNYLETLSSVGRSVTASLDLDEVLKLVVDAAVDITGAEEGSLLILDEIINFGKTDQIKGFIHPFGQRTQFDVSAFFPDFIYIAHDDTHAG